ncbi:2OG-Fe(II) oxygenase superfamily-domain containing protein [Nitzschia inconspicua]|uniref:2OG-Fe(II) oxygenase superfamily-domain containing protein n=1 Tax=Nitzschia inconspicua TaxID=303405 RepID=A0A9K3KVT0_9STRA|nr:2OG-Fe(II) oxygenase superfamily-domain containing protein [Nitzschia inconspicua]
MENDDMRIKITSIVNDVDSDESPIIVMLLEHVVLYDESIKLLHELSDALPFATETDHFGEQTRPTCYFGDEDCVFSYVGLQLQPLQWPEVLRKLRDTVEAAVWEIVYPAITKEYEPTPKDESKPVRSTTGKKVSTDRQLLTACLANQYPKDRGYIPWHYDEIRAHGPTKTVASLSLGGPRRFLLRKRRSRGVAFNNNNNDSVERDDDNEVDTHLIFADLMLPSGSVLLMTGNVQENYEHCLPLSLEQNTDTNLHRISLTFRSIVPGYEKQQTDIATDRCCCMEQKGQAASR